MAGIDDTDNGEVFTFKANPEGLVALATALLKGAQQSEADAKQPQTLPLDIDDSNLKDTPLFLPEYIAITKALPYPTASAPTSDLRKFLSPVGCLLLSAFLVASLVVGVITVVKWLF